MLDIIHAVNAKYHPKEGGIPSVLTEGIPPKECETLECKRDDKHNHEEWNKAFDTAFTPAYF